VQFRPLEDAATSGRSCETNGKKARVGSFTVKNQKSKSKMPPMRGATLEETMIHMEDPPKWLFLLEEGRFRRSKFRQICSIMHRLDV